MGETASRPAGIAGRQAACCSGVSGSMNAQDERARSRRQGRKPREAGAERSEAP